MKKVKVLIVDDSSTMRGLIATALARDAGIEVVGEAEDPLQARQAIKALNPDVITLDVEMPNMSGLEFLDKIMRLRPMPVIMVSTLTSRGADETIRALEIGAIDCIEKPRPGNEHNFEELPFKVKIASSARVRPLVRDGDGQKAAEIARRSQEQYTSDGRVLAIGASTGGVEALIEVLSRFPENCPPTVIAQHMPASFTRSFANRLDRLCAPKVQEATDNAKLLPGHIYLAPGGVQHLEVSGTGTDLRCRLKSGDRVNGHCPSVDVLFESVARSCKSNAVGLILTGMGRDGAAGLLSMRNAGAKTYGQSESSCIVYGMPKAALDLGAVEKELPLERLAPAIMAETSTHKKH
jgi:two-component system, chemotaxis family, protein-glutamate methylesterase/glutaminase